MFFDIGIGLLLASALGWLTGSEPSALWLAIGVAGSLWPDLDFIIWVMRGNKIDHLAHKHRDLLHRPLVLIPLLTGMVWGLLDWPAALLFGVASLTHFVHDTIGHGWGIRWFWPIDSRFWCYRAYGMQPQRLYGWTQQEQDILCSTFGDRGWLKRAYGGLSRSMMIELAMLLAGIASVMIWYIPTHR